MQLTLPEIFSLTILLGAFISAVRFRTADSSFLPFMILLWVGAANEVLSITLMSYGSHTAVNNNIYVLLEALLILWFFRRSDAALKNTYVFIALLGACTLFWIIDTLFVFGIRQISSYFRIFYSFIIVLLSINAINYLLFAEKDSLLKSPTFLISVCFVVFFTYKILIEAFWIKGLNNSSHFRNNVYAILVYLNLLVNLVFALVTLWIPRKQERSLLF
ncbi:MAG TPA: hypothetical protein VMR70_16295 [Flavisolibacter sp.]|nr:hypothetical protein [Flavisolibacter sp.]